MTPNRVRNAGIEAVLRSIATDTGAQLYQDFSTPAPGDEATSPAAFASTGHGEDEAECDAYQRMMSDGVDIPPGVDLINTWELIVDDPERLATTSH